MNKNNKLVNLFKELNIFRKNRVPLEFKIIALLCYYFGLSLRGTRDSLEIVWKFSHEAVRKWYLKAQHLFVVERKYRPIIAVDETKVKVNGKQVFVWSVIDVFSKEILAAQVTTTRSWKDAYRLLKKARDNCMNFNPEVLVDGGPWYIWACHKLGLKRTHVTRGLRNSIERWFGRFKHRVKYPNS
jgi:transposase-like protein